MVQALQLLCKVAYIVWYYLNIYSVLKLPKLDCLTENQSVIFICLCMDVVLINSSLMVFKCMQ